MPTPLEATQAQLLQYARDLRRLAVAGHSDSARVDLLYRQLQLYARDLRRAYEAEQRRARELEKAYHDTVRRLVAASRYKDEETGSHTDRVSHYARALAQELGWKPAAVELLAHATPMHDVGKIAIPDAILQKPGPLTEEERAIVQRHTLLGAELLRGSASPLLEMARLIALNHHERWDGSGYPHHIRGVKIPAAARIVRLADEYDALRSPRPYKSAIPHPRACDIILHGDGRTLPQHFDPEVLDGFRRLRERFEDIYGRYRE
ncbi:MAG TPA: HD domain-containing phosphohydrolase [Terriglobales bacterium]|nr:HD domain-containing phosphohydrolase [Terriglobales bacterium]